LAKVGGDVARPKRDHYETLGVNKDATPAEIKKARRRKAQAIHPDLEGGDESAMAEVNAAFDCLSDPQRRLLYDQTGQDGQRSVEDEVRNEILAAFADALGRDASDALKHARQVITGKQNEIKKQRSMALAAEKKLTARREKISVKAGDNLFHLLIDQQLTQLANAIAHCDRGLKVMATALKALETYESSEKAQEMIVAFEWTIGSASTGGGF
jgi:curved DNA-binding protein CbpA